MPKILPALRSLRCHLMQTLMAALVLACAAAGAQAQNLIQNPSNELALVNSAIPGWTVVQGTQWTQRDANPAPQDGRFYFFASDGELGLLRQDVDVSAMAAAIDAGQMAFDFSGWARSFSQNPPDTSTFIVSLRDALGGSAVAFNSGALNRTDSWQQVQSHFMAAAGTRTVRIDLLATRFAGNNNDGYFDNLSLLAAPVPEPASAWLMAAGALAWLARRRPRLAGHSR